MHCSLAHCRLSIRHETDVNAWNRSKLTWKHQASPNHGGAEGDPPCGGMVHGNHCIDAAVAAEAHVVWRTLEHGIHVAGSVGVCHSLCTPQQHQVLDQQQRLFNPAGQLTQEREHRNKP